MSGFLRREENAAALAAAQAELSGAPPMHRQRYECTCGYRGTRESFAPPSHVKCPRCAGVAVGRGPAELVQ